MSNRKNKIHLLLVVGIVLCVLFTQCNTNAIYHQYHDVDLKKGWNMDDTLSFPFSITDTTATYTISIEVRNTEDYAYENLWVYSKLVFPDTTWALQSNDIPLADHQGKWYGKEWGSFYTSQMPIYEHLHFSTTDTVTLQIQHAIRSVNLYGIGGIGIRIDKNENNKTN